MIPTTYKDYYGDETRWFIGTVLQTHGDPDELGRVKVRIFGIHPEDIPVEDLPWASVVLPSTEAGTSGFGANVGVKNNAQVWGIFLDGRNSQLPLILGSIPKNEQKISPRYKYDPEFQEKGFGNGNVSTGTEDPSFGVGRGQGRIRNGYSGKTRNQPPHPVLLQIISEAGKAAGVDILITSAGQDPAHYPNARRVGRTIRHDLGRAVDVQLYDGDQLQRSTRPNPIMAKFIAECVARGAKGIGCGPGYGENPRDAMIHVDLIGEHQNPNTGKFGSSYWGAGFRKSNAPYWVVNAYNSGIANGGNKPATTVPKQQLQTAVQRPSQASGEFDVYADKNKTQRAALEGNTKSTKKSGVTVVGARVGNEEVQEGPSLGIIDDNATENTTKKVENTSVVSDLTGGTISNGALEEKVIQANPRGMEEAYKKLGLSPQSVRAKVKDASPLPDDAEEAVKVHQETGVENALATEALDTSRKINTELGNPLGYLNEFGGIGSPVTNILAQQLSNVYNNTGVVDLYRETRFVPEGTKLVNDKGGKVEPPVSVEAGGKSNVTKIITDADEDVPNERTTYKVGQDDGNWVGANTRGSLTGGSFVFKRLTTTDHIESEFRFAANQRDIACMIIDWSNLGSKHDHVTVDAIHDLIVAEHNQKYGSDAVNNDPSKYGIQTHMYMHCSGIIKKVVPMKNPVYTLLYPKMQPVFANAIHLTINAAPDSPMTSEQMRSLDGILRTFIKSFPGAPIFGYRDIDMVKSNGPGFNVRNYVSSKFPKSSVLIDEKVTKVPPLNELADAKPIYVAKPQTSNVKLPNPDKTIKTIKEITPDLVALAEQFGLDNIRSIETLQKKAEQVFLSLGDGSGKSNSATGTLDAEQVSKILNNLSTKVGALKSNKVFDISTRTFKDAE